MSLEKDPPQDSRDDTGKRATEFIFIAALAILVMGAFVSALSYHPISARAPLWIMVPLIVLIGVQFNRIRKTVRPTEVGTEIQKVVAGQQQRFIKVMALIGWMLFLLLLIYFAGHYAGLILFLFVMLRRVGGESVGLSVLLTVAVTAAIFGLFEYVFNIELYRGLVYHALIARWG